MTVHCDLSGSDSSVFFIQAMEEVINYCLVGLAFWHCPPWPRQEIAPRHIKPEASGRRASSSSSSW